MVFLLIRTGKQNSHRFTLFCKGEKVMENQKVYLRYLWAQWTVFLIQNQHHIEYYIKLRHQKSITVSTWSSPALNERKISNICVDVACSMTRQEIEKDWDWLFSNVSETLHSFDREEDITEFVIKKIESVMATNQESQDFDGE